MAQFLAGLAGLLLGLCASYHCFKYQSQGRFENTHMGYSETMHNSDMGPGMMRGNQ